MRMGTAKDPVQPLRPRNVTRKGLGEFLPTSVQKSYFTGVGLMSLYRLRIEEIKGAEVVTSYTRWLECVQARGAENQEVYLTFSPSFERIWLEFLASGTEQSASGAGS
jgi:hypothetical protein